MTVNHINVQNSANLATFLLVLDMFSVEDTLYGLEQYPIVTVL